MRQITSRALKTAIVILFIVALLASVGPVRSQPAESVSELWLDVSLGPPLVDWFNQVARPNDIARVDHVERIDLLERVTVGRKLVVFKSAAEAEQLIPVIADKIDIVGYNLEHGPANPVDEQADPVGNAKRMRQLADQYDLELAFGPDRRFALSNGAAVAPYVDIFVLQVQRAQTNPTMVHDFVFPLVSELREANPDLQISVQVRTEGDVVAIVDLIDSMKDDLDGVSVLTSPETVPIGEALVSELQSRGSGTVGLNVNNGNEVAVSNAASSAEVEATLPELDIMIQTSLSEIQAEGAAVIREAALFWIISMAGALLTGALAGGIFTALILRRK